MKNSKVKFLYNGVTALLNYCNEEKIKNVVLTTRLNQNLNKLKEASDIIDKCVNQELIELEKKAMTMLKEQDPDSNDFMKAMSLLSEEEGVKHKELMVEYSEDMNKEYELNLILIDMDDIKNTPIAPDFSSILAELVK